MWAWSGLISFIAKLLYSTIPVYIYPRELAKTSRGKSTLKTILGARDDMKISCVYFLPTTILNAVKKESWKRFIELTVKSWLDVDLFQTFGRTWKILGATLPDPQSGCEKPFTIGLLKSQQPKKPLIIYAAASEGDDSTLEYETAEVFIPCLNKGIPCTSQSFHVLCCCGAAPQARNDNQSSLRRRNLTFWISSHCKRLLLSHQPSP
eukprot:m.162495 g.162495  ORF g.162495 m.162495 type:complete len:207 (+) comp38844_c0_seq6:376-996(+)